MGDYNIAGLNHREFEHLVQALGKKQIASGLMPFGDGPDGGREAIFTGKMDYPSKSSGWEGYLVLQCKFRLLTTNNTKDDGVWAIRELKKELEKYLDTSRNLQKPDYFLFAVNIRLTAAESTGTKDKVLKLLEEYAPKIGLRGYDLWSYDELCRFIDDNQDIRKTYSGFITSGDVLSEFMSLIKTERPDFLTIISTYLQKQIDHDQSARLDSAGQSPEKQIPLSKVFFDLPFTDIPENASEPFEIDEIEEYDENEVNNSIVAYLLTRGSRVLRSDMQFKDRDSENNIDVLSPQSKFAIVGGPGQGKSTIGQYLCLIYRAIFLSMCSQDSIEPSVSEVISQIIDRCKADWKELPSVARFPFRLHLSQYAGRLAVDSDCTIMKYITDEISRLTNTDCTMGDVKTWLSCYPWLLYVDGLDEVPPSSNRKEVLVQIKDFIIDAASLNADLMLVTTTRPQSYNYDFDPTKFEHLYLTPLSDTDAIQYGESLVASQVGRGSPEFDTIISRLKKACDNEATARLMRSPLQVTIMTLLLRRTGDPPRQRYRLFAEYYRTIYERELAKEGPLSEMLNDRKLDIDTIHYRTGLLMQKNSEVSGGTDAVLNDLEFQKIVTSRLDEVGVKPAEAKELIESITDSTLDRLVFIVRPREGAVSFEIRSLQEFMTAEALLRGEEELIIKRLRCIAPISHWRNVLLFAIGKCFAEKEHLLDYIHTICCELNDRNTGILYHKLLWGSRLALDILKEGVTKTHPLFDRLFTKLALNLLEIPSGDFHAYLADVYHSDIDYLYKEEIDRLLKESFSAKHISPYVLLEVLANKNVEWAKQYAENYWSDLSKDSKLELTSSGEFLRSGPSISKIVEIIPFVNLRLLNRISWRLTGYDLDDDELPMWLKKISLILKNHKFEIEYTLHSEEKMEWEIALHSIIGHENRFKGLENLPVENQELNILIAISRFCQSPTSETLARELKWLSECDVDVEIWKSNQFIMPWPFAACINFANTISDLTSFAELAAKGNFGSTQEWLSAEERWKRTGVNLNDLTEISDDRLPLDSKIADSGFPLHAVNTLRIMQFENLGEHWEDVQGLVAKFNSELFRSIFANRLLNRLERQNLLEDDSALLIIKDPNIEFLKTLISASIQVDRNWLSLDFLRHMEIPSNLDSQWIQFFEWLGKLNVDLYSSELANWRNKNLCEQLSIKFSSEPLRFEGLLKIIACFSKAGASCSIPKSILVNTEFKDRLSKLSAVLIRYREGLWDISETKEIANEIIDLCNRNVFRAIIEIIGEVSDSKMKSDKREPFLIEFSTQLTPSTPYFEECKSVLNRAYISRLNSKNSPLEDPKEWNKLGLPDLN